MPRCRRCAGRGAGRRVPRHRRRAEHRRAGARRRPCRLHLGHPVRHGEAGRSACWCSTTTAPIPAMQAAELLAEAGSAVEIVSPERYFAPEMGGLNHAAVRRGVPSPRRARDDQRAPDVGAARGQCTACQHRLGSRAGDGSIGWSIRWWWSTARCRSPTCMTRCARFRAISARSITPRCWPAGRRRSCATGSGSSSLFRIGDAVASRNIHAAIYDALRLAKDI